MKVIDEILQEWSYRCHDGIVDINDPKKKAILDQILKENNIDLDEATSDKVAPGEKGLEIDDEILKALINTDVSTKEQILKYLQKSSKSTSKNLRELLADKKLGPLAKSVIFDAQETGQEDDLVEYLESSNQITLQDLLGGENLLSLFEQTPLNDDFIQMLVDITGTIGNVAVGRGEVALITLLKGAQKSDKGDTSKEQKKIGDIIVDGKDIEVKNRSTSSGAILAPESLKRGSSKDINALLLKAIENIFTSDEFKEELIKNISKKRTEGGWLNKIGIIYKGYLIQNQNSKTKSDFKDEMNNIFKTLYGQYAVNIKNYLEGQDFNIDKFKLDISKTLAKGYYDEYKFNYILFIDPSLNYVIYNKDEFIKEIGEKIKIGGFSDLLPRLSI